MRLSVVKSFWPEVGLLQECPEGADPILWAEGRVLGVISKWGNVSQGMLRIQWYDMVQTNGIVTLVDDGRMRFEKYADGRAAPSSRGAGARGTEERSFQEEEQSFIPR